MCQLHRQLPPHRSGQAPQGASSRAAKGAWVAFIPLTSESAGATALEGSEVTEHSTQHRDSWEAAPGPQSQHCSCLEGQALSWERTEVSLGPTLFSRLARHSCVSPLGASGQQVSGCWPQKGLPWVGGQAVVMGHALHPSGQELTGYQRLITKKMVSCVG